MRWDNGGYVAEGIVAGPDVHYVIRLGADFRTRQLLLFRDLDEPDLWLATDGRGGWGEMNGVVRDDLEGCFDVVLGCTPFTDSIPVRALDLAVGESVDIEVAWIDVETLGIEVVERRLTRVSTHGWEHEGGGFDVDRHGLVVDRHPGFRRVMPHESA